MGIRSFLAFELPTEIRGIMSRVSKEMQRSPLDVRWVKPTNVHLTIVFLGTVTPADIEGIQCEAGLVCGEYRPFTVALSGAGTFPNRRNPRVLWLGLDGELERIASFKSAIEMRLRPYGIRQEKRSFRPHLTLGRFRKGFRKDRNLEELLGTYQELRSPRVSLDALTLYRSDLKKEGAVYTKLMAWPLTGGE
jgi:2'-5' RNA ligase